MRSQLAQRITRLEASRTIGPIPVFRSGWLTPLPADFEGERHVALVSRQPGRNPLVEWCEFEERPGTAPSDERVAGPLVYLRREQ